MDCEIDIFDKVEYSSDDDLIYFLQNNDLSQIELDEIFLVACRTKKFSTLEFIFEKGANLNPKIEDYLGAIFLACLNLNLDAIKFLIKKGVDVNQYSEYGCTPLEYVVDSECDGARQAGSTPDLEIIRYLLENGANPTIKNSDNETPMDIAKLYSMQPVIDLLESHSQKK